MKTILLILILISLPTIGDVANLDRKVYLRLVDGYASSSFAEFKEANERFVLRNGITFEVFIKNIFDQFLNYKDNVNGKHEAFCMVAMKMFAEYEYYQAADAIRNRYLLPMLKNDVENDNELQIRKIAALTYIGLDPEDLFDVSKVILTREKTFLFFERIAYCEALIEYLQKTNYRSNSRAAANRNSIINLIVTEINFINKKDNTKTIIDVKNKVIELDEKLSNATPEYRNSNARETILRNVINSPRRSGAIYPEVDTRLSEIEAIPASSRTNITIKTKAEWKAEIE